MNDATRHINTLPTELRHHILSLLPPNDLALGGRLSCKDAAQRFYDVHHRTASLRQQHPPYTAASLAEAVTHLTLRQRLWLLAESPRCGTKEGVDMVWQVLQPHLPPEQLLGCLWYQGVLRRFPALIHAFQPHPIPDIGCAAVESGVSSLLPTLVQRCPGLLDPCHTLEAAARHCSLTAVQAAWDTLGPLMTSDMLEGPMLPDTHGRPLTLIASFRCRHKFWTCMMAAAAASCTVDGLAKMEWVLRASGQSERELVVTDGADVYGAAASSGDRSRLCWLQQRGFPWQSAGALAAVLLHANLDFIVQLVLEGGYLPRIEFGVGGGLLPDDVDKAMCTAACSPRDSTAKLQWLASRGLPLVPWSSSNVVLLAVAVQGNQKALQMLVEAPLARNPERKPLHPLVFSQAVRSGDIGTVAWIHGQRACTLLPSTLLHETCLRGDLAMARWLLEAGVSIDNDYGLSAAIRDWPAFTVADGERLVEVLRLMVAAGWPVDRAALLADLGEQPWAVMQLLRELGVELHVQGLGTVAGGTKPCPTSQDSMGDAATPALQQQVQREGDRAGMAPQQQQQQHPVLGGSVGDVGPLGAACHGGVQRGYDGAEAEADRAARAEAEKAVLQQQLWQERVRAEVGKAVLQEQLEQQRVRAEVAEARAAAAEELLRQLQGAGGRGGAGCSSAAVVAGGAASAAIACGVGRAQGRGVEPARRHAEASALCR